METRAVGDWEKELAREVSERLGWEGVSVPRIPDHFHAIVRREGMNVVCHLPCRTDVGPPLPAF